MKMREILPRWYSMFYIRFFKACINLNGAEIQASKESKSRFNILCHNERSMLCFECVLDADFPSWFASIQANIDVSILVFIFL